MISYLFSKFRWTWQICLNCFDSLINHFNAFLYFFVLNYDFPVIIFNTEPSFAIHKFFCSKFFFVSFVDSINYFIKVIKNT